MTGVERPFTCALRYASLSILMHAEVNAYGDALTEKSSGQSWADVFRGTLFQQAVEVLQVAHNMIHHRKRMFPHVVVEPQAKLGDPTGHGAATNYRARSNCTSYEASN
jgi:hypothetical protein